jgi:type VI secretion system secreted protein Hcp
MKYGDIAGDATQEGFEHWINIKSFSWGGGQPSVERKIRTDTGRSRNREHAQPHIKDIVITKEADHATGLLLKALCTVPQAKECKIAFVRTGEGGDKYLEYSLTDALLAGVSLKNFSSPHGPDRPTEDWTINFTEIEVEVKQLDEANVSQPPFHFKYNLATGKGG